ncbi:MAG: putative hydrolase YutF [Candidatus Heimdallarchaeota archaeon LC_2]|nr:MAG: putative hydrolase YutF [Candidatus Heimdallarchaeota archaeon LC_2]
MLEQALQSLVSAKVIIFDSDGCLVEEGIPYPYVAEFISLLKSLNKKIVIFTNNSTQHPDTLFTQYQKVGVTVDYIINSGTLAVTYCKEKKFQSVYIVGEKGLTRLFKENGFRIQNENVDAVIVGMDRTLTYQKLVQATRLIRNGSKFIATNPDKSFPTNRGLEPGAGSMIAAIEASTDQSPSIILGKPNSWGYIHLLDHYLIHPDEAVMLGDRYETDILGAQNAGIPAILMQTGVMAEKIKNNITIDTKGAFEAKSIEILYQRLKSII